MLFLCTFVLNMSHDPLIRFSITYCIVTTFQNIGHPNVAPRCPWYKKAEGPFIQGKSILNHIGIPTTLNSEFPLDIYQGTLFCFVVVRSTEPGCFRSGSWYLWKGLYGGHDSMTFGLFEKLSTRRGAWAWFHDLWSLWKALHEEGCMGLIPWPLESLKSSPRGGVHGLDSMTFGLGVQKFLNIEWFLQWKLN